MRNLEFKARISDPTGLQARARSLGADLWGDLRQTDTYFTVRRGRLKLRETAGFQSEHIYYEREESAEDRPSDYTRVAFGEGADLGEALSRALGVLAIVRKRRTLLVVDTTRIHLDDVEGLGHFLEIEVPVTDQAAASERLASLLASLGVQRADGIRASYADLVIEAQQESTT